MRQTSREQQAEAAYLLDLRRAESIEPVPYQRSREKISTDPASMIVEMISRRPCTVEDIALTTGLHLQEVGKLLRALSRDPRLMTKREERGIFYSWVGDRSSARR